MVRKVIQGTSNKSAAEPDQIRYHLIKAILGTRLWAELVALIGDNLKRGVIPTEWKETKMVMILKPGRDLTRTKNW